MARTHARRGHGSGKNAQRRSRGRGRARAQERARNSASPSAAPGATAGRRSGQRGGKAQAQQAGKKQTGKKTTPRQHTPARRPAPRGGRQAGRNQTTLPERHERSAGGLVLSGLAEAVRENGSVDLSRIYGVLIGRLDRRKRILWSLPKGHVEDGEDLAATAEREVWEETGIYGEAITLIGDTDYWFISDGVRIHKTVHHHLLRYVDGVLNADDPEVTEVAWIPVTALIERLAYMDERKLAHTALDMLEAVARAEHAAGRVTPR